MQNTLQSPARHWVVAIALLLSGGAAAETTESFTAARARLLHEIARTQAAVADEAGPARISQRTLDAIGRTPRHAFVPPSERDRAYANVPLPIGHGQTISQPYIVALMTELLGVHAGDRVFELGTGSGYQAAVLAELGAEVWTIEIVPPLGETAARTLAELGYDRVHAKIGDGYHGWAEHAPYDAIVVTAAASHVPPPLVQQLKPGGRLVIPVGTSFLTQHLILIEKDPAGVVSTRQVLPVRFVPLTGGH